MELSMGEACARLASARVARLATVGADAQPHLVPVTFAADGNRIYTAVDHKPKTTSNLRRLRNIQENPLVALLADYYAEDWDELWWVRADGAAHILDDHDRALDMLVRKYQQYQQQSPEGPFIIIEVERWTGWAGGNVPESPDKISGMPQGPA
jgi:PPOX class probable F420-dependent enzyme